jgi:hypothetical protein
MAHGLTFWLLVGFEMAGFQKWRKVADVAFIDDLKKTAARMR